MAEEVGSCPLMHVMIPKLSYEDRCRSLGALFLWWTETFVLIGRGDATGEHVTHSPEYIQFALNAYALDKNGRRRFDRCSLWRPKGCNKSGLGCEFGLFEALGPCRFDHWAVAGEYYEFLGQRYYYLPGEPVGRPVQRPEILCLATSEDQTGNIFDSIHYNCKEGPLSQLQGEGMVVTKTGISLPEGGEIVPSTSGDSSKDGGLETFVLADEIHLYKLPRHISMYKTVQRNLPKRSLEADPWLLEMTTYYRPGENSVAESVEQIAHDILSGRSKHYKGLYFDYRYSTLPLEEFSNEKKLEHALYESYGSAAHSTDGRDYVILPDGRIEPVDDDGYTVEGFSLKDDGVEPGPSMNGWVNIRGLMNQIYQPDSDVNDSIRYYLNSRASSEDSWLTEPAIQSHVAYKQLVDDCIEANIGLDDVWKRVVKPDDEITLGFDGSIRNDSTAIVGCRVSDGLLFIVRLEQKPDNPLPDWRVNRDAFDAAMRRMLDGYNVIGVFADPHFFESMIGAWESEYGRDMKVYARGQSSIMKFWTNNWGVDMYHATQNAHTGFEYDPEPVMDGKPNPESIRLLADPRLIGHFRNARRRDNAYGYAIYKETPKSPKKIDACIAGILAYAARSKYLSQLKEEEKARTTVERVSDASGATLRGPAYKRLQRAN